MPKFDNNLVVIGAGSAGLIAALIGATARAKVTLIEREKMGGDCLHTGCVPSKTLIASAKVAHAIDKAQSFGIDDAQGNVNFESVMARIQEVIAKIQPKDSIERYTGLGVDCTQGDATVLDGHHVQVDRKTISTRSIIVASGAEPAIPPIPGLADIDYLTSNNLWTITELPRKLLVLGGGPIGVELAQAFGRLGSQVTIVEMEPRILPLEDADAAAVIESTLVEDGVDVRTATRATRFSANRMHADVNDTDVVFEFDKVLLALGRRPRSHDLGLEEAGIQINDNRTIKVNSKLQTSVSSVYACGDIVGPYQFTHMASHQAWYAAVNALARPFWSFDVNYNVVPWAIFTDPELARVGLSEKQARETFENVNVTKFDNADSDRLLAEGQTKGFVKVVTAGKKDTVVGACIVGMNAGELISEYVSSMTHGFGLKKIMGTIHVYPTAMETIKSAASQWRKSHAPEGLLSLAEKLNALQR